MKTIYLTFLIITFGFTNLQAQVYVNKKNINEIENLIYIEVKMVGRFNGRARIDYGDNTIHRTAIRDKNDKVIIFENSLKLLNFLYQNGWMLQSSYAEGEDNEIYYIFIKKEKLKELYNKK